MNWTVLGFVIVFPFRLPVLVLKQFLKLILIVSDS